MPIYTLKGLRDKLDSDVKLIGEGVKELAGPYKDTMKKLEQVVKHYDRRDTLISGAYKSAFAGILVPVTAAASYYSLSALGYLQGEQDNAAATILAGMAATLGVLMGPTMAFLYKKAADGEAEETRKAMTAIFDPDQFLSNDGMRECAMTARWCLSRYESGFDPRTHRGILD